MNFSRKNMITALAFAAVVGINVNVNGQYYDQYSAAPVTINPYGAPSGTGTGYGQQPVAGPTKAEQQALMHQQAQQNRQAVNQMAYQTQMAGMGMVSAGTGIAAGLAGQGVMSINSGSAYAQQSLSNPLNCKRASMFVLSLDASTLAGLKAYADATPAIDPATGKQAINTTTTIDPVTGQQIVTSGPVPSTPYESKYAYVLGSLQCEIGKFCAATCEGNDWQQSVWEKANKPRMFFSRTPEAYAAYDKKMADFTVKSEARKGRYCQSQAGASACLNLCEFSAIPNCMKKAQMVMPLYVAKLGNIDALEKRIAAGDASAAKELYNKIMPQTYRAPMTNFSAAEAESIAAQLFPSQTPAASTSPVVGTAAGNAAAAAVAASSTAMKAAVMPSQGVATIAPSQTMVPVQNQMVAPAA